MKGTPLVSVLIPTHNYGRFLDEAINSVLTQTYPHFELIIVDNHSNDDTAQVVGKYLSDERVKFYQNHTNIGLVANWNRCLGLAKGEYIKFLMADDIFLPGILEEMIGVMEENPGVSLVTSNSEVFGAKSRKRISEMTGLQNGSELIVKCVSNGTGNLIGEPTTVMFRRSDVQRVGRFNSNFTCLVDLNMWLRLLEVGDAWFIPKILSGFRIHNDQYSARTNVGNWIDEYRFYREIKEHNPYSIDASGISRLGLDQVLKDRAIHCARGMYRMLPKLLTGKNYAIFSQALSITARERVMGESFYSMLKKYF